MRFHVGTFRTLRPSRQALYQPDAGILASERCIRAHVAAAQARGALLHERETVRSWCAPLARVVCVKVAASSVRMWIMNARMPAPQRESCCWKLIASCLL